VPLHCTASGKLFLSQMSAESVRAILGPEPYERFTSTTITTFKALQSELEKTRRTKVGLHDSERFADSVAIAVPIADPEGRYFAAVAMHAPASRASIRSAMQSLPALHRVAQTIAATMASGPPVVIPGARAVRRATARRGVGVAARRPARPVSKANTAP
jgi:DNA-binding IclR family transcriptional regulator